MAAMHTLTLIFICVGCLSAQLTAPPGAQGPKGETGEPGPPGAEGPKGDTGEPGDSGQKGDRGAQGNPGIAGIPGEVGATGSNGTSGSTGLPGPPGAFGELGATGATGEPGATGVSGTTGFTGRTGPKGEKGARGPLGVDGSMGIQGEKGEKGEPGILGVTGDLGDQGPIGPRGLSLMELDQNECDLASDNNCDAATTKCLNWATGYRCVCNPGYKAINTSIYMCEDINECLVENGDCAGSCLNTVGSYECACSANTKLTVNNQCSDIDECTDDPTICGSNLDIYCINKYDGYTCASSYNIIQDSPVTQESRVADLSANMMTNAWIIVLLIWLAVLTLIAIIILFWLIHVFHKMRLDRARRQLNMYDAPEPHYGGSDDEMSMAEGMAGAEHMDVDLPIRPPRSHRGTMKGASGAKGSVKGSRSYKGGSKPGSVSSNTGKELKTASIKQHRVATGERSASNRLSGVDTFY